MVDFGDTLFDTNLGSSVPIVDPVENKSSEYFARGLKSGLDGAGSFLALDAKNRADAANASLNEDIVEKMSLLADARDQGKMTLAQANRQLRVWSNEWVSNFPDQTDSIFTLVTKLGGDRGIAGSIYTETPAEKGRREMLEEGAKNGWDVSTPQGVQDWEAFKNNTRQLEIATQQLQAMQTSNQMISETQKANYTKQFQTTAASAFPWVQSKIGQANTLLQGVSDPVQRQAIIDQLKNEVATQTGMLSTFGGLAGAESLDYLIKPINDLMTVFEQTATGKSTQQALETAIAQKDAQFKLIMFSDPKWGQLFMMNETTQFTDPESLAKLDQARMEFLAKLGVGVQRGEDGTITFEDKPPDVVDTVDNIAVALEAEKNTLVTMLSKTDLTPEQTQAMNDRLANVLQSIKRNGAAEDDATNFNAVVNYLADTSVGQWMETNYAAIGQQIATEAGYVVERQYSDVVLDLVNQRWLEVSQQVQTSGQKTKGFAESIGAVGNQQVGSEEFMDLTKLVEPVWNGYGVEFRVRDEYKNDANLQGIARQLNTGKNSVTGPVNKLIRMSAHLTGTTDYEKIYNENFKNRLWVTGENAPGMEGVDQNENLETVSNIPEAALQGKVQQPVAPAGYQQIPSTKKGQVGALLDSIGEAEGANYNTLFGYAEQPGGAFEGEDITTMTLDEVQALQKMMVRSNGISSAVGKYQFIQDTLREAIAGLGLSPDTKFTPDVQDALALWLLQNRTSFNDWILGNGDSAKFQNELATQWASVPNTSGRSAYAGDGINKASAGGQRLVGML